MGVAWVSVTDGCRLELPGAAAGLHSGTPPIFHHIVPAMMCLKGKRAGTVVANGGLAVTPRPSVLLAWLVLHWKDHNSWRGFLLGKAESRKGPPGHDSIVVMEYSYLFCRSLGTPQRLEAHRSWRPHSCLCFSVGSSAQALPFISAFMGCFPSFSRTFLEVLQELAVQIKPSEHGGHFGVHLCMFRTSSAGSVGLICR